MQVEVLFDEKYKKPKVLIMTNKMSNEVNELIQKLSNEDSQMILGFKEEYVKILDPSSIYRIYTEKAKVLAETTEGIFTLRLRLYEIEEQLKHLSFVRISNTDIINLKLVDHFDLRFSGTICIVLLNKHCAYASRRYVTKIKEKLGI